jgi:hypothetical protein
LAWTEIERCNPAVMIVIASYYALFAVMGGSIQVLLIESAAADVFLGAALAGFKSTLWLVVTALAAHGIFDLVHSHFYANPGVPAWRPSFCLAYDVSASAYLAWLLASKKVRAYAASSPVHRSSGQHYIGAQSCSGLAANP